MTVSVSAQGVVAASPCVESGCRAAEIPGDGNAVAESAQFAKGESDRVPGITDIQQLHMGSRPVSNQQTSVGIRCRLGLLGACLGKMPRMLRIGTVQNLDSVDALFHKEQISRRGESRCEFHRVITGEEFRLFRTGNIEDP